MIALFAAVVSAAEQLAADQITFVPTLRVFQCRIRASALLAFPFQYASQRGERTADAVALVSTTGSQRATGFLAEDVGLSA